ncbi:MAG TPA: ABC transporter ATP-binding protein [Bacteroidota bacterium]|nr:ABC transporter ATP-binding protein [Bacteroidota bacterium]
MSISIELSGVSKSFGPVRAVDRVHLHVGEGELYGFLGRNGAGKTTTIRMLLGMLRADSGTLRILGQPVTANAPGIWSKVGHLVETPAVYPELSVVDHLEMFRRLRGVRDVGAVERICGLLSLGPVLHRKAGALSLGNVQRLGLARALLHRPRVLILDEPSNALDPAGVVEIRDLLLSLVRSEGVTVFMSSHILSEVERTATRIGIIHNGQLVEELDADRIKALRAKKLRIVVRDVDAAILMLRHEGYQPEVGNEPGVVFLGEKRALEAPDSIAVLLVKAGTPPLSLMLEKERLEEHFLRLTEEAA